MESELTFIDLEPKEPKSQREAVEGVLRKNGFLKELTPIECDELCNFITHGLNRSGGADISSYVRHISHLSTDRAISTLGSIASKIWSKQSTRKAIFPYWNAEHDREPTKVAVSYGVYNWIVNYMSNDPYAIPYKMVPTIVTLYIEQRRRPKTTSAQKSP